MYTIYVGSGIDGSARKGHASQCRNCGKCVERCTQHIDIPTELRNVTKTLETPDMKILDLIFRPAIRTSLWYDRWKSSMKARTPALKR